MDNVRARSAPGSVLLADICAERFVTFMRSRSRAKLLELTGETGNFALPVDKGWESELRTFVAGSSFTPGEAFCIGTASAKDPFMAVIEMVV
ncbi:MAG: hypothetical protein GKS06_12070 [Acidobacteria bacterium]|nr:hypothetical protein [Acidobacteriota bacterium]